MIKVIKHGQTEFKCTCGRCGCEFTYEHEDIHTEVNRGLTITYSNTTSFGDVRYVKCPDCGNICYLPPFNTWSNVIKPISDLPFNTPSGTKDCHECDWWKKITQPGGFTYVGDTPCTWCSKNPYRTTCWDSVSSISTNTLCKDTLKGVANDYTKITCESDNKTTTILGSTTAYSGNIGSFNIKSIKEETSNG